MISQFQMVGVIDFLKEDTLVLQFFFIFNINRNNIFLLFKKFLNK
jgi:hypothetical protein